ncbi:hypothetical protein D3C75_463500 [compost metagenome]
MKEIEKGDTITFTLDGEEIIAKCTGVTHKNLIHFYYKTGNGTPIAGTVGRSKAIKVDA